MLWQIEIRSRTSDPERARVAAEYDLLTHTTDGARLVTSSSRGYLIEGDVAWQQAELLARTLLVDGVVETGVVSELGSVAADHLATVLLKPGVMDPAALSVAEAARDLGVTLVGVRTFRRYFGPASPNGIPIALRRVLANDAIEQVVTGPLSLDHLTLGRSYTFALQKVALCDVSDDALVSLSKTMGLALNREEMRTIQAHFRAQGREPTDVELETIAQTWSEHCSHKTLRGIVEFEGRRYQNLLKETIFAATVKVRESLGADDWCVSVFEDNAGVVKFDDKYHACIKVETHNRPSAIEPYGGANTGIGGVIRDPLGTALGAKPVCNTDVFCFAPPDMPAEILPEGVLHPRRIMHGVVAGVRDYGNRMGIPTVNGAVCFDARYVANPLVYCGTVGIIPVDRTHKQARPGDVIVSVGGRTGRDGIHGATFSSQGLHGTSEQESGGAVQIGNPITQKKLLDVILQLRDLGLYSAITDCGAGGFSSAVGEMGADIGAVVHLERAPLKYEGLSYTEIWISESQERMILAVPPENLEQLCLLCASEDVEATALGEFEATGRLRLLYQGHLVADMDLHFLHEGRPAIVRKATRPTPLGPTVREGAGSHNADEMPFLTVGPNHTETLTRILGSLNVASKEWIIRQYDHEVQGGSVIKPLVGVKDDGPSDAAVIMPVLGSMTALAVGCGINPRLGDLDPYAMAACAIDEAVRNVVAVGADPARVALLDNFCWGDTDRPEVLGSLVLAAQACHDTAVAFGMPFVSGKDSLKNEYNSGGRRIVIPPTLLISAMGRVPDARLCVTMDLKETGNILYLIGATRDEMGGSHYNLVHGIAGGCVPQVQDGARQVFARVHEAIKRSLVRACHDLSEGGLAVAVAEMAFAGGIGADLTATGATGLSDHVALFSESPTRFIVEVRPDNAKEFEALFAGMPLFKLGTTVKEPRLRIAGASGEWLVWAALDVLKEAWQRPLRF